MIKKVKNTVPLTYVLCDHNGEEIAGTLQEKELQKTIKIEFINEKVIKRKGDKLYIKFWIDKKDIVLQNELFS